MKFLKYFAITVLVLLGIILIVAAVSKKEHVVTREIVIDQPQAKVFEYIRFQKNQRYYSKWFMADPAMKTTYKNSDGAVGFVTLWNSNDDEVGQGEQEITAMTNNSVSCEIRFVRPFEGVANTEMSVVPVNAGQSKVAWSFKSTTPFPMNAMMLFVDMDEMLGGEMQQSLQNLKEVLEP